MAALKSGRVLRAVNNEVKSARTFNTVSQTTYTMKSKTFSNTDMSSMTNHIRYFLQRKNTRVGYGHSHPVRVTWLIRIKVTQTG